jgi:hypothetical protein
MELSHSERLYSNKMEEIIIIIIIIIINYSGD